MRKLYGRVERNYKFSLGVKPEDYNNHKYYRFLEQIHAGLAANRGFKEFVRAPSLPNVDFFVPNPGFIVEFDESQHFTLYRSPDHTLSPRQMAKVMNWKNRAAAHFHYGNLAGRLRDLLKRSPQYNVQLLCSFDWDDDRAETVWVMHDNVVRALEHLGWVKSHPQILAARGLYRARKKDLDRVRAYIAGSSWCFSRAMPQWPHCYVLREWGRKRDFDFFAKLIDRNGYIDPWGRNRWKYLVVDNLKYWIDDNVLNRAKPKLNEWFREYGKKYIAKYGRRVVGQPRC